MIRDVFYYNKKPNVHPREKFAESLEDARQLATTEHFWIINEYGDYKNFDWDWDFDFLPDEDVWAQDHNNVWPSQHQKDSGTWLCPKDHKGYTVYRADVDPVNRKNEITECWNVLDEIDQTKFDFSWHPDPTDPPYIYVWGNKWVPAELKPTIEYHVEGATDIKFMTRLVELVEQKSRWKELELIDKNKFDSTWRPDPTEPPFIYKWGCKYFPVEEKHVLEYHVPDATEIKYMDQVIELLPEWDRWKELELIDKSTFDFTWRPDPTEPSFIYKWGCKYFPVEEKHVLEYRVPDATEIKYMDQVIDLVPEWDRWKEIELIDKTKFDLSWRPDPKEPPFIYKWASKYYSMFERHVLEYHAPGATEVKYMDEVVELESQWDRWKEIELIDKTKFDFTWRPDLHEPPFIYKWGCKYYPVEEKAILEYHVPEATDIKFMDELVELLPEWDRWKELELVDKNKFDFTWRPDPKEPAYIYKWGCKYFSVEEQHVLEYRVPNATEIKYMDQVIELLPEWDRWKINYSIDKSTFDFSWRPDPKEPPYIYVFGNKQYSAEKMPTVEYYCAGANQIKYMDQVIELLPEWDRWKELELIDKSTFDFTWRPDPTEPPFIYKWGCKYFSVEEQHVLEYRVPEATEIKYMNELVELLPEWDRWKELELVDKNKFDFTWRPDPKEPPFIYKWGCKYFSVEEKAVLEYHVPDAIEIKYMNELELVPEWDRWKELELVDKNKFDFTWRPDPKEPPFIYKWGCKYFPVEEKHVLEYRVPEATDIKFMDELLELLPEWDRWKELELVDKNKFDFTWRPDPKEPPFIYKWGCKYFPVEEKHVLEYHVPDAIEIKYMNELVELVPEWDRWKELELVDKNKFDFTWRPDPKEPPFVYQWGCKYYPVEEKHVLEYRVPEATDIKFMDELVELLPEWNKWKIIHPVNKNKFDFTWRPDPKEPPYIYVFGNKQYSAEKMPTIEYRVSEATERKYIDDIKAILMPNFNNWQIPSDFDKDTFDFTWHPDPHSPPYIYQFGSIADKNDGPRYVTPDNTGDIVYLEIGIQVKKYQIVTTLDDLVKHHSNEVFWATRKNINYQDFDFTWRPDLVDGSWESTYVSVFGSVDSELTQTYFVNAKSYIRGNTQLKFIETTGIDEKALSNLFVKPDMFFVDRYNQNATSRFEQLKERFPSIQKVRYISSWVDTINRCANKATTELFWIIDSELDYTNFDFNYYPNPWQMKMLTVFGTQWSRWGTTFLVNKEMFPEDTKYVKIIEHLSMINFVKDRKAKATQCQHDIVLIDHGNKEANQVAEFLALKTNLDTTLKTNLTTIKYDGSYLRTFKNLLTNMITKKEHYLWLCSSVCDYTNFDFTYISDPFARDQLHVFPSEKQKFGDTFLLDVNKTKLQLESIASLEDYEKINFNQSMRVDRLPEPTIIVHDDTHATAIPTEFDFPYVTMISHTDENIQTFNDEPMNLWSPRTKTIIVASEGATKIIVPKEAKEYVKRELYDYPYIKKANRIAKSKPLDIVFLSNGEQDAEENYEHLLKVTHKLSNRVTRVDGINGRVQAYHAALEASNTPWAFTVFAKLKVNDKFDWAWQPDRMQVAKHYIFYAENPVNGLVYGHQAMIAYQKSLVLNNIGRGLDFTLDDEHEVVEEVSGTAMFNTDAFATWRTAFREVIKLKAATDHMSKQRLNTWLTTAEGNFADYCLKGAKDASEYYNEVEGEFNKLKLSYEWAWLKARFDN